MKFNSRSELVKIIRRYVKGIATVKEKQFLESYYEYFEKKGDVLNELSEEERNKIGTELETSLMREIGAEDRNRYSGIFYIRLAAAATVIIALAFGLYFYSNKQDRQDAVAQETLLVNDIPPGGNKATLTLADGTVISLDDAAHGEIAKQSGISISKASDGQLIYTVLNSDSRSDNSGKLFNTIETPRGGEYQVNLPDGTKVWLNAVSSLRYPVKFSDGERRVELDGEAYFEVAENKARPFLVISNNQVVEVLGTHFNINSYADESSIRTSLLEGKVKVSIRGTDRFGILAPGQESAIKPSGSSISIRNVDVEESIAWKNGYFIFTNEDIRSIMRRVSRWYDVDIEYSGDLPRGGFGGNVSKSKNISEILRILELTKAVRFKIEGRRVMVMR